VRVMVRSWWHRSLRRPGRLRVTVIRGREARGEELEEATIVGGGEVMTGSWRGSRKIWGKNTQGACEGVYIVLQNINNGSS
jgi:hypothetical protein